MPWRSVRSFDVYQQKTMTEPTYTLDQLMQMIRFTRHSARKGEQVYTDRSNVMDAFRRACDLFKATHGNDSLRDEYVLSRKNKAFTRDFLDRLFPYAPGVTNSQGLPLKFIDYGEDSSAPAPANTTVPPIDPAYTAKVVEASEQRELEKELAEIYLTIDAIDLSSDPFPVDLGEAARWLGYSGEPRTAKASAKDTLMAMNVTAGVDYQVCRNVPTNPPSGGRPPEEIRLTGECFKKLCQKAGTKRAERVREYFILAEQRFRAAFKGEDNPRSDIQVSSPAVSIAGFQIELENAIRRVIREEAAMAVSEALDKAEVLIKKHQTPVEADLKRLHGSLYQQVLEQSYRFPDGSIHCPCCNKPTTSWEVDHWNSKTNPARTNGWKVCRPCNQQVLGAAGDTKRHQYKSKFDAFQVQCDAFEQYLKGAEVQLGLL